MNCCQLRATDAHFSHRVVEQELQRYRSHGPGQTTRLMLDALRDSGVTNGTLLDIGGGIGALHHELIDNGIREATEVEPAAAYLRAAESEARRRGHEGRVRFMHGQLADVQDELPVFDVVTLDRVLCCDPDVTDLIAAAAGKSRNLVAVSFPQDRWYVRLVILLHNIGRRLRGDQFRTYVHPNDLVEAAFANADFVRAFYRGTLVWQVIMYRKA